MPLKMPDKRGLLLALLDSKRSQSKQSELINKGRKGIQNREYGIGNVGNAHMCVLALSVGAQ